jgi:formylglycine-generating enzyme required for sulfatase activity
MKHVVSLLLIWWLGLGVSLMANNIAVSNVSTTGQDTSAGTNDAANYTMVEFDLSWDNSWRTSSGPSNRDAAWVFVKFMVGVSNPVLTGASSSGTTVTVSSTANLRAGMPVVVSSGTGTFATNTIISSISSATQFVVSATPSTALSNATVTCQRIWEHASLDATANNHTIPVGSTISVPSDSTGAFIYWSADSLGNVRHTNVQLRWQYGINGVADDAVIQVQVFAIEMVYVPQGSFAAGSGGGEASAFTLTTINTATATTVPSGSGGFSGSAEGGYPSGQTAPANASWPNGYDAFYCMKYEISQGDYRDFLNTLTYTQQISRAASVTGAPGTAALSNSDRNGLDIMTSGVAATFIPAMYGCNLNGNSTYNESADGEWIACNFLSWMDGCAYVDWAGLRPMTELEYEKACRGGQAPVANEYAWGSTSITQATSISSGGANNETSTGANCAYGNEVSVQGPLRVGAFAGGATTRAQAGATYYGIMEMSGNLWERAVTIGNADGRGFTGVHGNGRLSAAGHANQTSWPGLSSGEVTGASGSGFRGGSWFNDASRAGVSDRNGAASADTARYSGSGFRGVRVFP